jgi:Trk K+ transport system NAD-binding subunit
MIVLFIIVFIGIVLYGYLLMGRLDKFIEKGGFRKVSEASGEKEILLYGEPETIGSIAHALDAAAITYDFTTEPAIMNGIRYQWLGAFSADDADNLLICLSAKRMNSNIRTIAKCNNVIYENVFRQTGITVILQNDIPIGRILACLKG